MKKLIFILVYLLMFGSFAHSNEKKENELPYFNTQSDILGKLLFFKDDRFKVFYGGPVSHDKTNKGIKWIMPALFQDKHYKTRVLYDILFVNCDLNDAKNAEVLFLNVSDINIKFKNLLSDEYKFFNNIISGNYSNGKYIVVRQADFGMIYYPDIFISSLYSNTDKNDKEEIVSFLVNKFGAKNNYKTIFKRDYKDVIKFEDDEKIIYKPMLIKTKINDEPQKFYITKMIVKNDKWKLYYIVSNKKQYGDLSTKEILLRLDSGCVSGQIYGDQSCDCSDQLHDSLKSLKEFSGDGLIIHIPSHDGRGFGTAPKLETEIYKVGGNGRVNQTIYVLDTISAAKLLYGKNNYDLRTFDGAANILKWLGINKVLLITDNVLKTKALRDHGIQVKRLKTNSEKASCLLHLHAKRNSEFYYPG